jgi:hypothetical protein
VAIPAPSITHNKGFEKMPTFSTALPPVSKHHGYDLRRTPSSSSLQAICTANQLLVCDTHYWRGRTLPCERITNDQGHTIDDSACPACLAKQPFRSHVYVSAFDGKTHEHFIFECTCFAAKPLAEYIQGAGTLRGCVFHASRPKGTPNGKVVIVTNTANLSRITLPNAPDVATALSVIWRLPRTAVNVDEPKHAPSRVKLDRPSLAKMRNQPDNVEDPPTIGEILSFNGNGHKEICPA